MAVWVWKNDQGISMGRYIYGYGMKTKEIRERYWYKLFFGFRGTEHVWVNTKMDIRGMRPCTCKIVFLK